MTRDEKFTAIVERLKIAGDDFDPAHISAMVIVGYLDDMSKAGLIESEYSTTESGRSARAICEEFDWKPSDIELLAFVNGMVDAPERSAFMFLLKKYRDDRQGLLEEFEKSKQSGEIPPTA